MNAPDKALEIKGAIAAIIAFLTTLWGWTGWAVVIWLGCVLLDYIAGSVAAKSAGEWSSSIARAGLWHKLGEIFAVLVAALTDIALSVITSGAGVALPVDVGPLVTPVVLLWYIITELGSIVENAGKLGAPIPAWLRRSLAAYRDKLDEQQGGGAPTADSARKDEEKPKEPETVVGDPYEEVKRGLGYRDDEPLP